MKDRLLQLMQLEQLSPAKFADILGIQRSGLSHILSGRNKPGYEFISKLLLKFPTVSAEWLITGKGKMYKQELVQEQHIDRKKENSRDLFSSQIDEPQKVENQLRENSIKIENKPEIRKNRVLMKIIMIYDDMTFEEIKPSSSI
ncbi:MAG: helix-turn-helix transcriptional regulator [Bacteroidales bacterium]